MPAYCSHIAQLHPVKPRTPEGARNVSRPVAGGCTSASVLPAATSAAATALRTSTRRSTFTPPNTRWSGASNEERTGPGATPTRRSSSPRRSEALPPRRSPLVPLEVPRPQLHGSGQLGSDGAVAPRGFSPAQHRGALRGCVARRGARPCARASPLSLRGRLLLPRLPGRRRFQRVVWRIRARVRHRGSRGRRQRVARPRAPAIPGRVTTGRLG